MTASREGKVNRHSRGARRTAAIGGILLLAAGCAPSGPAVEAADSPIVGQAAAQADTPPVTSPDTPPDAPPAYGDALIAPTPSFQPVEPPPAYMSALEAGTRAPDGRPGPDYWQNRVDYRIDVRLEPETARLSARSTVSFHNHSPEPVEQLVVRLYQNVFSEGVERNRTVQLTGGVDVAGVSVGGNALSDLAGSQGSANAPGYRVVDTRMLVILPEPVAPGASADLGFEWAFRVSGGGGFRNGHLDHEIFNIAQWYPQIAVVDDVWGADGDPYLGDGEFYVDYGDFDVAIDVPAGWVVVATGELENPRDVLRDDQVAILAAAAQTDTVAWIVSHADVEAGRLTRPSSTGRHVWRFRAENVRDFAWAASSRYAWNVTGAETGHPSGRALVQGVYDPAAPVWSRAVEMGQHAIEFFSRQMLPYPYPTATVAYGPPQVGGMEYPMITFINHRDEAMSLNGTTTHELSHFWVPMIVGTKENAFAWMDEGLTTFNTAEALIDLHGDTVPDSRTRTGMMASYLQAAAADVEVPIMRHTDYAENGFGRSIAAYRKPGMLTYALRHMMGAERFDAAYRDYVSTWAYKHPTPWDFFAMMEEAAGTDLDWFWQAWFYDTATLDQAVERVEDAPGGIRVTVSNRRDGVMPVELHIELADGSTTVVDVWPVNVWAGTREVTRFIPLDGTARSVQLDPEAWYPDVDRTNNAWERPGA